MFLQQRCCSCVFLYYKSLCVCQADINELTYLLQGTHGLLASTNGIPFRRGSGWRPRCSGHVTTTCRRLHRILASFQSAAGSGRRYDSESHGCGRTLSGNFSRRTCVITSLTSQLSCYWMIDVSAQGVSKRVSVFLYHSNQASRHSQRLLRGEV